MSISKEGVVEKMRKEGSVVLNVLPEAEFLKLHIRGSYSLPMAGDRKAFAQEVRERFGEAQFFITYADNITSYACVNAAEALQKAGIPAEPYLSGMKEWTQAGLPTAVGLAL